MNREERRALKLIITDRVMKGVAKENKARRENREHLDDDHSKLLERIFADGVSANRIIFDEPRMGPRMGWRDDNKLSAGAELKLTAGERKMVKDSEKAVDAAPIPIDDRGIKGVIDLVLAEAVFSDKADALKKVDGIVKEIMKRLTK